MVGSRFSSRGRASVLKPRSGVGSQVEVVSRGPSRGRISGPELGRVSGLDLELDSGLELGRGLKELTVAFSNLVGCVS